MVTGGSGFLGWNVCRAAAATWNVRALVHRHRLTIPGATIDRVDLLEYNELKSAMKALRPDAVVHLAAASQPNWCQEHPSESRAINVTAAMDLAGLCADSGADLAFISTDLVFDGKNSPYREEDSVSPVSLYAEQKVEAERAIADRCPNAAILRMPLMFGDPGPVATSFIQPFLRVMRSGEPLRLFTDETRTPVGGATAADGILRSLGVVRGLLHLGGRERVSRYEFGRLLADVLEIPARLEPCLQRDIPMPAPRPSDVSLDSSRAYALGYDPPPLRDQIAALRGIV